MPLINCRVELSLGWIENCALSGGENIANAGAVTNAGIAATFKITVQNFMPHCCSINRESVKLSNLLIEGFKRSCKTNARQSQTKINLVK